MPKPRSASLESPTARLALAIAKRPYWVRLGPGLSLGYRRNQCAGTWSVRIIGPAGGHVTRLATADDYEPATPPTVLSYWQAMEAARGFARREPGAPVDEARPITLGEALDRYESHLLAHGGRAHNAQWPRRVLPPALLAKPVQLITAGELRRWRDSLVGARKADTVNRLTKGLSAALVLAGEDDPRIRTRAGEFKAGLKALPSSGGARNVILEDGQARAFVAAAYALDPALGLLADVLAVTGSRPSQAIRLTVGDLVAKKSPRLMMPRSGKGGGRDRMARKTERVPVPIGAALAGRLKAAAAGRPASALLLRQGDGLAWPDDPSLAYRRTVRDIVASIGLDPDEVTIYSLRHSAITRQLLANCPPRIVAAVCDTSVAMLERHYSKDIASHSDEIFRRGLLQDEAADLSNIVPLARSA